MKKFLADNFAVLIVLLVFALLFTVYVIEVHWGSKVNTLDWLEGEMKEVIGAILMGLTGGRVRTAINERATDKPEAPK